MAHCHYFHDNMHNLKHIERQMRLLDTRLHLLRDRLSSCRLHRLAHHHCCPPHLSDCHLHYPDCHWRCLGRRPLCSRLDLERRLHRKICDPCDGKVTVSEEHKVDDNGVTYSVESNSVTVEGPPKCCHHHCEGSPKCCHHHCDL